MIFIGDIAHPFESRPSWTGLTPPWRSQPTVPNLEGALCADANDVAHRELLSHQSIVPALKGRGVKVALLANNRVLDLPERVGPTLATLGESTIDATGAGVSRTQARRPASIAENGAS